MKTLDRLLMEARAGTDQYPTIAFITEAEGTGYEATVNFWRDIPGTNTGQIKSKHDTAEEAQLWVEEMLGQYPSRPDSVVVFLDYGLQD